MRTRVRKWGNSLALRIPRSFAADTGLRDESTVEVTLIDGKLVIDPQPDREPTLAQLLAGVSAENLHGEVDTGSAVGRETW